MSTLSSTSRNRTSNRRTIAGAVLALALAAPTGAFAQASTPIGPPKQVGVWMVNGYSIGLSAPHWELKPQTAFPVELIAQPVMRNDASALAVNPKLVIIELGA